MTISERGVAEEHKQWDFSAETTRSVQHLSNADEPQTKHKPKESSHASFINIFMYFTSVRTL